MAKVLLISTNFPPEVTAGAFRTSGTASWLQRLGFEVTVLTARPHRAQVDGAREEASLGEVKVVRAPLIQIGDKGGVWYLVQFLSFTVTAVLWGLARARGRYDFVIASSPPLFVGISGWVLAVVKRAKLVMDIRDLWPDSAVATGQLPARGPLRAIGHWLERFLYRRARLITCVSAPMKEIIAARVGAKRRIEVIYNGVDARLTEEDDQLAEAQERLSTIVYAGNVGRSQGLEILVEAAACFPELTFEIIGSGVRSRSVQALAQSKGVENLVFTGPRPREDTLRSLAGASALFLQLRDEPVFATTIPSKVFDYLTANRPILFGLKGEGAEILSLSGGNVAFESDNLASLADAVERLASYYDRYAQAALKNRSVAAEYSREKMTRKLAQLLTEL